MDSVSEESWIELVIILCSNVILYLKMDFVDENSNQEMVFLILIAPESYEHLNKRQSNIFPKNLFTIFYTKMIKSYLTMLG